MIVEGITGSRLSFRTKGRKYFGRKGGWGPDMHSLGRQLLGTLLDCVFVPGIQGTKPFV